LLHKDTVFNWTKIEDQAFKRIKSFITKELTLAHYDINSELVLTCDASPVGLGAVLEIKVNGVLKPVSFVSRSLTTCERNYSQIEREALSIVFALKKYRQYLLGRHFILRTDHRPLTVLFGENNGIPQMVSSRIKRWALVLSAYSYSIEYIPTKENGCADFLSRKPLPITDYKIMADNLVLNIDSEILLDIPIKATTVCKETRRDKILCRVMDYTQNGWPDIIDNDFKPYYSRRTELSVEQGCLLWGNRIIIPESLRAHIMLDLHETHIGVVRMKALSRQYFWWPNLSADIEQLTKACRSCQENAPNPAIVPVASWNWPSGPWVRLHLDFAGPFQGHMFLIVVDSYSKWLDVFIMKNISSQSTIAKLRMLFATHGLPNHIVTDNGTSFVSEEFQHFLHMNGIKHTTSAPGHPATNGMAERYVGFVKQQLRKMDGSGTIEDKLSRILLTYRSTPHPATNSTPSSLLMKRELRTKFTLLKPCLDINKETQIFEKNFTCTDKFKINDKVFALNLRSGPRWIPGKIINCLERNYYVEVNGSVWKRHANQLRLHLSELPVPDNSHVEHRIYEDVPVPLTPNKSLSDTIVIKDNLSAVTKHDNHIEDNKAGDVVSSVPDVNVDIPESPDTSVITKPDEPSNMMKRYPKRERKPPNYLKDFIT
jgi:transposase InsO family protein